MTHDRTQAACLEWLWNYLPFTRYTATAICNEPPYPMGTGLPEKVLQKVMKMIRIAMFNLGILPGALDFQWYWRGRLYIFDVKIGRDVLSDKQKLYIAAIEAQGGKYYEIETLAQFQQIVNYIIAQQ